MEKLSEAKMRDVIATVAGPREWGDTRESWLARAARRSGVTYRQAKALFYGEIDEKHLAARAMRHVAEQIEARKAAHELARKFEAIASSLNATDEDFHRNTTAALVDVARALRGLGRAGDRGGAE